MTTNDRIENTWAGDVANAVGDASGAAAGTGSLARGLGWFSVALGTLQSLAPREVATWLGVGPHWRLVRACGVREIANGIGILRQPEDARWLWARSAGDLMDLAALARANHDRDPYPRRAISSTTLVVGITLLDVLCGARLGNAGEAEPAGES